MNYIIIQPLNGKTSKERAEAINAELYKISVPNYIEGNTQFWLSMYEHPDTKEVAIGYEATDDIPVHSEVDVTQLKGLQDPSVTDDEKNQLEAYINSKIGSRLFFYTIVPSTATVRTYEELEALGWFNYGEI